jgi:hypothetical protein
MTRIDQLKHLKPYRCSVSYRAACCFCQICNRIFNGIKSVNRIVMILRPSHHQPNATAVPEKPSARPLSLTGNVSAIIPWLFAIVPAAPAAWITLAVSRKGSYTFTFLLIIFNHFISLMTQLCPRLFQYRSKIYKIIMLPSPFSMLFSGPNTIVHFQFPHAPIE